MKTFDRILLSNALKNAVPPKKSRMPRLVYFDKQNSALYTFTSHPDMSGIYEHVTQVSFSPSDFAGISESFIVTYEVIISLIADCKAEKIVNIDKVFTDDSYYDDALNALELHVDNIYGNYGMHWGYTLSGGEEFRKLFSTLAEIGKSAGVAREGLYGVVVSSDFVSATDGYMISFSYVNSDTRDGSPDIVLQNKFGDMPKYYENYNMNGTSRIPYPMANASVGKTECSFFMVKVTNKLIQVIVGRKKFVCTYMMCNEDQGTFPDVMPFVLDRKTYNDPSGNFVTAEFTADDIITWLSDESNYFTMNGRDGSAGDGNYIAIGNNSWREDVFNAMMKARNKAAIMLEEEIAAGGFSGGLDRYREYTRACDAFRCRVTAGLYIPIKPPTPKYSYCEKRYLGYAGFPNTRTVEEKDFNMSVFSILPKNCVDTAIKILSLLPCYEDVSIVSKVKYIGNMHNTSDALLLDDDRIFSNPDTVMFVSRYCTVCISSVDFNR